MEIKRLARGEHILLAPRSAKVIPGAFRNVQEQPALYDQLLSDMQRLRGHVYLQEGAIQPHDLTPDGCHYTAVDEFSWHLLTVDDHGRVAGCARLYAHSCGTSFDKLLVSRSALALCAKWGSRLRAAVNEELAQARRLRVPFVEPGGWVLTEKLRHSVQAVHTALGAFAWGQLLGGALGITTATTRNHSSSILSRIGGTPLRSNNGEMPMYFDAQYGCDMKILRFDAGAYAPKYHSIVVDLLHRLSAAPVVCAQPQTWTGLRVHPAVYTNPNLPAIHAA